MTGPGPDPPLWREPPEARRGRVLGIGQNALDRVVVVARYPRPGEKQAPLSSRDLPGGQVATAVLTCARLGLPSRYVGCIGDDAAGRDALAPLEAAGVDLSGVVRVAGSASQTAVILVERDSGERTILWHRPAALALTPGVPDADAIRRARLLLLDAGDPEAAAWAAGVARGAGVPVVLDADRYRRELDPLLERVDFPLVSRGFAETMEGPSEVRETLRALHRRGARLAAVTLGSDGVAAWFQGRALDVPAVPIAASDTTGAGDVFHGAFAWGLLEGFGARRVLRVACAAAALNCLAAGAQGGIPDRAAVEALLAKTAD